MSVHRIVKQDLKLLCFRTAANKCAGLFCAKQLLRKYPEHTIGFPVINFTVALPMNLQNDLEAATL